MSKEELEKEAKQSYLDNTYEMQWCAEGDFDYTRGYLAGAEPREKRIAELEAQNLQLLKEWRVMDKEKQKAELKVAELMGDVSTLEQDCKRLEAQIEKMKSDVIKSFGNEYNVLVAKLLEEWEIKEK